jgi:glycosyltransferase involved in cell wall biosynthesis
MRTDINSVDQIDIANRDIVVDELHARQRSLRIAVVTETYPPEVNGVAMTIARFVDGLRTRGHDVQLVRPRQTKIDQSDGQEVLMRGLPIPRYPHLKMGLPAKRSLLRLWSTKRPDLVHIVTEGPLGWSALQAALKLRLPVTSDFRTNFHAYSSHYGIGWLQKPIFAYLRKFHNRTQCTMVPTPQLKQDLEGMGFRNLRVVARGVDTKLFSPAKRSDALRNTWGATSETPVVVYVGRIAAEKNISTLVAAFHAMQQVRPDCKLVFVGDGPQRAELQARLPFAFFAGVKRGEDLAQYYASGDVFLFPSVTETFGNVTPEAMASGMAVVAYRYAAASELIESGMNGVTVAKHDTMAFCEAAKTLLNNWPQTRAMGVAARATAETLGWERLIEELETAFFAAIENASSQSTADNTIGAIGTTGTSGTSIDARRETSAPYRETTKSAQSSIGSSA